MWARRCASHGCAASLAYVAGVGQTDLFQQGEVIRRPRILFRKQTDLRPVSNAVHCEELDSLDVLKFLKFKPEYRGQFAPCKPDMKKIPEGTVNGPVFGWGPAVTLQGGPFNSIWLRIHDGPLQSPVSPVATYWLDKHFQKWHKSLPGAAFYVSVSETSDALPDIVKWCQMHGLRFHHYHMHSPEQGPSEYVYYKWHGQGKDLVPPYTTSDEGVGVLTLSPDEREVLLVWEYGCWKMVTGIVDPGEGTFEAATRECFEETGITVDPAFKPQIVCGVQTIKARDKKVNNSFYAYTLRAKSKDLRLDGVEIKTAKWFPLDALLAIGEKPEGWEVIPNAHVRGEEKPIRIHTSVLIGLHNFSSGKGFPVTRLANRAWFT
eukprot:gnl/MRDRNA2_/MRDRNA2_148683_c0_seq1.p1 gnl/MRDRNA2_/MRDRNA2_148683_c0~~gnl/MRDRNA2_/MRDRNA2_148683_c0_seq1.p1  ORF type:complete len:376 (+),score=53.51 gnl/MRDRNA2_/MRDRNA2_148683_c0_seq1:75-1202(+)